MAAHSTHQRLSYDYYPRLFSRFIHNCERFVDGLVECEDPVQKMALCGRLAARLALLQPMLLDPVPEHLKASLTVDDLPLEAPRWLRTENGAVLL
ncbi:hypothetical protein DR73_4070 [Enterobacteriaceae bacterium ATCC 29904]|nr:hypothetical protein [uncultured Leclercia sp.]KGB09060.1 hypothetical protein DR73_4070 [Enterobacteriaceae bacterium ATCC 29904]